MDPIVLMLSVKGPWAKDEDDQLKSLVASLGPAWAAVCKQMNSRNADRMLFGRAI